MGESLSHFQTYLEVLSFQLPTYSSAGSSALTQTPRSDPKLISSSSSGCFTRLPITGSKPSFRASKNTPLSLILNLDLAASLPVHSKLDGESFSQFTTYSEVLGLTFQLPTYSSAGSSVGGISVGSSVGGISVGSSVGGISHNPQLRLHISDIISGRSMQ